MKKQIDDRGRILIPLAFKEEIGIKDNDFIDMQVQANKIIISKFDEIMTPEEIKKMYKDVIKLNDDSEYNKGFIDALKMILKFKE